MGCSSYPTSKHTYWLIHSSEAGAVVRSNANVKNGIISGLILMVNSSALSMKILSTQVPNPTPEKKNSQKAICPSPASRRHYEMSNQSGLCPHLCPQLLTVMSRWSNEPLLLLRQHMSKWHLQNYHKIQSDMELGPSNLLVDLSISTPRLPSADHVRPLMHVWNTDMRYWWGRVPNPIWWVNPLWF